MAELNIFDTENEHSDLANRLLTDTLELKYLTRVLHTLYFVAEFEVWLAKKENSEVLYLIEKAFWSTAIACFGRLLDENAGSAYQKRYTLKILQKLYASNQVADENLVSEAIDKFRVSPNTSRLIHLRMVSVAHSGETSSASNSLRSQNLTTEITRGDAIKVFIECVKLAESLLVLSRQEGSLPTIGFGERPETRAAQILARLWHSSRKFGGHTWLGITGKKTFEPIFD